MSTTITIRTEEPLRKALEEHARARGVTLSQVAREILQDALTDTLVLLAEAIDGRDIPTLDQRGVSAYGTRDHRAFRNVLDVEMPSPR